MGVKIVLTIIITLLIFPPKALAYLDPGTGSYIIQILFGGLVGGIFIIKTYWQKIITHIRFFINKFKSPKNTDDSAQ